MVDCWLFFGLIIPFLAFVMEVLKELLNSTQDSEQIIVSYLLPSIEFHLICLLQSGPWKPQLVDRKRWKLLILVSSCAKVLLPFISAIFIICYFVLASAHYTAV